MAENRKEIEYISLQDQQQFAAKVQQLLADKPSQTAYVHSYGCQANVAEGEKIKGVLSQMGYGFTEDIQQADLILLNTCAVRGHAEKKTLSITGGYKNLKAKKPSLLIGICGCMVSKKSMSDKIKKSYPYVDFVFGTESLWRMPEILHRTMTAEKRFFYPNVGEPVIAEGMPVCRESKFRAWVSIMYGCNNFCTYCIVPYVRGGERSRRPEHILREVEELVASGCREITLLGQNVNSYGKEFGGECNFAELLRRICAIEGDFTVRFMTSHPKDASRELIDVMAENPKIARHFHLPVQSGSDRILQKMNRVYSREHYLSLIRYMREKMPDITITSDIIVGFPGETEEDFEDTLSILREVRYDMIYSFIYSPREGTPAAEMEQIPAEITSARFARLLDVQNEIALEKNLPMENTIVRVLIEGRSKTNEDKYSARTDGNKLVLLDADDSLVGTLKNVKITKAQTFLLWGELVK